MTGWRRWVRFNGVGLAGVAVQLVVLDLLLRRGVPYLPATAVAVSAAVVHNFGWHTRWTWGDRRVTRRESYERLRLFIVGNGGVSLLGNLLLMPLLVGAVQLPPVPANAAAIVICGLANYWVADVLVFAERRRPQSTTPPARGGLL